MGSLLLEGDCSLPSACPHCDGRNGGKKVREPVYKKVSIINVYMLKSLCGWMDESVDVCSSLCLLPRVTTCHLFPLCRRHKQLNHSEDVSHCQATKAGNNEYLKLIFIFGKKMFTLV